MNINYHQQPTGNTCGPTCLKMVHSSIFTNNKENITIEDIAELCGTDWIVGTPPDRMEKGLKGLGLNYNVYVGDEEPFERLQNSIVNKNIVILRTLTQGVPHWVIVESFIDDVYNILDPWLGRIQYTRNELNEIWVVRDYFYFEIK